MGTTLYLALSLAGAFVLAMKRAPLWLWAVAAAVATPAGERGKTVCVVTGGSIDTDKLLAILGDPGL